ncbi:MAG: carbamate kinase, partial [Schaedlerella arabinosiphila]|nr:carbamate kinase [Schaedlerella arabinosiphila]
FYTEEEAKKLEKENGYTMKEDAGRGWRRVVASPIPRKIVEIEAIKNLWKSTIVVSCGGGGIPVVENPDGTLEGVAAVIDKDHAAELLAEQVEADILMILTEVEKAAVNWGSPNQKNLDTMSLKEAAQYVEEGQFAPGSMLPKVEACMKFVRQNPQKKAIITSLDKALEALEGKTGTVITFA